MTHDIKYPWKSFKIHLPTLHQWMRSNAPKYVGASAGAELTLHFSEEPKDVVKDRVQMYMDALTEEGEANNREWDDKRKQAKEMAEAAIPTMSWDSMVPAERKIVMGKTLVDDDLDALVKKHLKEERYP